MFMLKVRLKPLPRGFTKFCLNHAMADIRRVIDMYFPHQSTLAPEALTMGPHLATSS